MSPLQGRTFRVWTTRKTEFALIEGAQLERATDPRVVFIASELAVGDGVKLYFPDARPRLRPVHIERLS